MREMSEARLAGSVLVARRCWSAPAGALLVHLSAAALWMAWPAPRPPALEPPTFAMVLAPEPEPPAPPAPAATAPAPARAASPPKPVAQPKPTAARPAVAAAATPSPAPAATPGGEPAAALASDFGAPIEATPTPSGHADPDLQASPAEAPRPSYPMTARKRGWQGVVMLTVRVAEDGSPLEVAVKDSSGYSLLDDAALEAVRRWRFSPARRSGRPVMGAVEVPVRFALEG